MPKPPKALIFDLDGVLVDSEPLHRKTWIQCLAEQGIPVERGAEGFFQGRTGEQVAAWIRSRPGAPSIDAEALVARKRELYDATFRDELTAIPGVDEFLRRHKGTLPLGLVTSSGLKTVGQVMLLFNWRNIFDALVGREHVANTKPHPEPFERAAQRLRLRPEECLVFEDSAPGIQAARAAGASVCAIATSLKPDALLDAGAHWIAQDFRDAAALEMALSGVRPGRVVHWLRRVMR